MRLLYGNGDAYLESDVEITVFKIRYKGKTLVSDCPRKLKGLLRDSWVS